MEIITFELIAQLDYSQNSKTNPMKDWLYAVLKLIHF